MTEVELIAAAMSIANKAVMADIQAGCPRERIAGVSWWDTRPLLDPRENGPESLDMAAEAIDYAVAAGVVVRHQTRPYLVRFTQEA